jgi:RNA recognition motif-containing protein
MLRNIPNRCSHRALITELEALSFAGLFDFVYIPLDHRTMSNVGYAFVNFVNAETAAAAMKAFETHRFKQKKAGKRVAASVAYVQGLEANMRHYERSAAGNSRLRQRRPIVLTTINSAD